MQSLFIYDNYGTVVTILGGVATVPEGVQAVIAEIPDRMTSCWVNPATKEVVFEVGPDTEDEVTNLQNGMVALEMRVAALEEG